MTTKFAGRRWKGKSKKVISESMSALAQKRIKKMKPAELSAHARMMLASKQ